MTIIGVLCDCQMRPHGMWLPFTPNHPSISNYTPSRSFPNATNLDILAEDDEIVELFQKGNYKIPLTVRMHQSSLHAILPTVDTGVGPNLVDRSFLCPSWRKHIRSSVKLRLKLPSNQTIHIKGIIELIFVVGDLHADITIGVVYNFVVLILLGTSSID